MAPKRPSKRAKAKSYLKSPARMLVLVRQATHKAKSVAADGGALAKLWEAQKVMLRMVQAYARREYTVVPKHTILLALLAIVYFVSPIDIIPDLIPGIGLLDDATVIAFVISSIRDDLQRFKKWETRHEEKPVREGRARVKKAAAA